MDLTITHLLPDQELDASLQYWEGAVRISGSRGGWAIGGAGYVVLSGCAEKAADHGCSPS